MAENPFEGLRSSFVESQPTELPDYYSGTPENQPAIDQDQINAGQMSQAMAQLQTEEDAQPANELFFDPADRRQLEQYALNESLRKIQISHPDAVQGSSSFDSFVDFYSERVKKNVTDYVDNVKDPKLPIQDDSEFKRKLRQHEFTSRLNRGEVEGVFGKVKADPRGRRVLTSGGFTEVYNRTADALGDSLERIMKGDIEGAKIAYKGALGEAVLGGIEAVQGLFGRDAYNPATEAEEDAYVARVIERKEKSLMIAHLHPRGKTPEARAAYKQVMDEYKPSYLRQLASSLVSGIGDIKVAVSGTAAVVTSLTASAFNKLGIDGDSILDVQMMADRSLELANQRDFGASVRVGAKVEENSFLGDLGLEITRELPPMLASGGLATSIAKGPTVAAAKRLTATQLANLTRRQTAARATGFTLIDSSEVVGLQFADSLQFYSQDKTLSATERVNVARNESLIAGLTAVITNGISARFLVGKSSKVVDEAIFAAARRVAFKSVLAGGAEGTQELIEETLSDAFIQMGRGTLEKSILAQAMIGDKQALRGMALIFATGGALGGGTRVLSELANGNDGPEVMRELGRASMAHKARRAREHQRAARVAQDVTQLVSDVPDDKLADIALSGVDLDGSYTPDTFINGVGESGTEYVGTPMTPQVAKVLLQQRKGISTQEAEEQALSTSEPERVSQRLSLQENDETAGKRIELLENARGSLTPEQAFAVEGGQNTAIREFVIDNPELARQIAGESSPPSRRTMEVIFNRQDRKANKGPNRARFLAALQTAIATLPKPESQPQAQREQQDNNPDRPITVELPETESTTEQVETVEQPEPVQEAVIQPPESLVEIDESLPPSEIELEEQVSGLEEQRVKLRNSIAVLSQGRDLEPEQILDQLSQKLDVDVRSALFDGAEDVEQQERTLQEASAVLRLMYSLGRVDFNLRRSNVSDGFVHDFSQERNVSVLYFDGSPNTRGVALGRNVIALNSNLVDSAKQRAVMFHEFVHIYQEENPDEILALAQRVYEIAPQATVNALERYASSYTQMNQRRRAAGLDEFEFNNMTMTKEAPAVLANLVADFIVADDAVLDLLSREQPGILSRFLNAFLEFLGLKQTISRSDREALSNLSEQEDEDFTIDQKVEIAQLYKRLFRSLATAPAYPDYQIEVPGQFDLSPDSGSPMLSQNRRLRTKIQVHLSTLNKDKFSAQELQEEFDKDPSLRVEAKYRGFDDWYDGFVEQYRKDNPKTRRLPQVTREDLDRWISETQPDVAFKTGINKFKQVLDDTLDDLMSNSFDGRFVAARSLGPFAALTGHYTVHKSTRATRSGVDLDSWFTEYTGITYTDVEVRTRAVPKRISLRPDPAGTGRIGPRVFVIAESTTEVWGRRAGLPMQPVLHPSGRPIAQSGPATFVAEDATFGAIINQMDPDTAVFENEDGGLYAPIDFDTSRGIYPDGTRFSTAQISVNGGEVRSLNPAQDLSAFSGEEDYSKIRVALQTSKMDREFPDEPFAQSEVLIMGQRVDFSDVTLSRLDQETAASVLRPKIVGATERNIRNDVVEFAQYEDYWYDGKNTDGFSDRGSDPTDYREVRLQVADGGQPYIGSHFGEVNKSMVSNPLLGDGLHLKDLTRANQNYIAHYRRDIRFDSVTGQATLFLGEMQFDYQGDKHKYGTIEEPSFVDVEDLLIREIPSFEKLSGSAEGYSDFLVTNQITGRVISISGTDTALLTEYTNRQPVDFLSKEDVRGITSGMLDAVKERGEDSKAISLRPLIKFLDKKLDRTARVPSLPFGSSVSAKQSAKRGYLDLMLKQIVKDAVDNGADRIAVPYCDLLNMLWARKISGKAIYQAEGFRYEYDPDNQVLTTATLDNELPSNILVQSDDAGPVKEVRPDDPPIGGTAQVVPMVEGRVSALAMKDMGGLITTPVLNSINERINAGQYKGEVKVKTVGEYELMSDLAPAHDRVVRAIRDFFIKGSGRGLGTVVERTTEHGLIDHVAVEPELLIVQLTDRAAEAVNNTNSELYVANMDVTGFDADMNPEEEKSFPGLQSPDNSPTGDVTRSFVDYISGKGDRTTDLNPESPILDPVQIDTRDDDLKGRSMYIGNILFPALRCPVKVVGKTASTMINIELEQRKLELTQQQQDGRMYDTLPRKYRKDRGEKFFDLMDKVRVAPHEVDTNKQTANLPAKVRRALAHFKARGEDMRLELVDQKRQAIFNVAKYKTQQELVDMANLELPEGKRWRLAKTTGKAGVTARVIFDSDGNALTKEDAARAIAEIGVPDDWGYQYEHIHHAFFGNYRLGYLDKDKYNAAKKRGATDFQARRQAIETLGDANSYADAAEKLAQQRKTLANDKFLTANALKTKDGETVLVAIPNVHVPDDVTQRLSSQQYRRLIQELSDAADVTSQEIFDATRGIVSTKRSKNAFYAAMLERTGAVGYSKDFIRVWSLQTRGFHRYVLARKIRDTVYPAAEKMRAHGLHKWGKHFEELAEFVINPSGDQFVGNAEKHIDSVLEKVFGGGSGQEKGLLRGILPIGHRPLRRMLHSVRTLMYLVTLKTPRQYVINSFQPLQTVLPVIGEANFVKAVYLYNTPTGKKLIRKYGALADPSAFKDSPSGGGIIGLRALRRIKNIASSVLPYLPVDVRSEVRNQNFAFLALFQHGKRIGMTDSEAAEFGRVRGSTMTQYAFTRTTQPPIIRGPIAATAFQYKRFMINQIQLGYSFLKRGRSRDEYGTSGYGAFTRFMSVQLILAGVRGLVPLAFYNMGKNVFCKFMPETCEEYGGPPDDDLEQFRLYIQELSGSDKLGNATAHGIFAGLLGIDISGSLALLDRPYGRNLAEQIGNTLLGPAGNTVIRAVTDQTAKQSQPRSPIEVLGGSLMDSAPAVKAIVETMDAITDMELSGKKMFNNRGEFLYEATVGDRLSKMLGFRTMKETEVSAMKTHYYAIARIYDNVADQAATMLAVDEPDIGAVEELLTKHNATYPELAIGFSDLRSRVLNKLKNQQVTAADRFVDRTNRKIRNYMNRKYGSVLNAED